MKTIQTSDKNGRAIHPAPEIPKQEQEPVVAPAISPDNSGLKGGLEQHECNKLLPPMLPDQFRRLKDAIRKDGLEVPIVLCDGQVLDGWQRYQICRQLQIEPRFEEFTGKQVTLRCWTLNASRTHLESSQLHRLATYVTSRILGEGTTNFGTGFVLNMDCIQALKLLPDGCIDSCVCSPPYYKLRDYDVQGQLGWETTPKEYIERLCEVFDEVRRVLKPTGTCWVNLGDSYGPSGLLQIPARFAVAMADRGWILPNEIVWHKPNLMPQSAKRRFTMDFEKLFFFAKSKEYYFEQQLEPLAAASLKRAKYKFICNRANNRRGVHVSRMGSRFCNPKGRNKRSVWTISPRGFKGEHFATYPKELCEIPIKAGCPVGGVVLDPFAGTGTTLLAARNLFRRYVGIELNPNYCRIIEERLNIAP